MSLGPVGSGSQVQQSRAVAETQKAPAELKTARAADPKTETVQAKEAVSQDVQDAARKLQQGVEQALRRAVPPAPGEDGQGVGTEPEQYAGKKKTCGRGGKCIADGGPVLGLARNIA